MTILDKAHLFRRALGAEPDRLHFAAHSHHLWPDVTGAAQAQAWEDAACRADEKWDRIFGEVYPAAQGHIASVVGVGDPSRVAFSANTHDLLIRLLSATPAWAEDRPMRVLSTDAEFHSFTRQLRRMREAGRVEWRAIDAEPLATLPERFRAAAAEGGWDVVFASHVFFSSGHVFQEAFEILGGLPEEVLAVVDGYHGTFAVPTDLGPWADRVHYLGGGYKYAMAGEGASFLVAPPGRELRPEITGWFAGFSSLRDAQDERVGYDDGAARFLGATFEPTPLYRLNAVCDMLRDEGLDVDDLHRHSIALQARFMEHVARGDAGPLRTSDVFPAVEESPVTIEGRARRGNFLTFRRDDAQGLHDELKAKRVITDVRGDRLRFGFGLYHTAADVDRLAERLR